MPSKPAAVKSKKDASGLVPPRRPTRSNKPCEPHSTAPLHRSAPAPWRRLADVVYLPGYVAGLRARLSADLLASDPDQDELGRLWGDRRRG